MRTIPLAPKSVFAGTTILLALGWPCFPDVLLENGVHAGSLSNHSTTFGWFIEGEARGLAFKTALSAQLDLHEADQSLSSNHPDFVVFVAAKQVLDGKGLNRSVFSFLTEAQIVQLQTAGLGQKDCEPKTFATEAFQVATFVTIRLQINSSLATDTQLLNDCIRTVLAILE